MSGDSRCDRCVQAVGTWVRGYILFSPSSCTNRLIESSLGSVATKLNFFIHNLAQMKFTGSDDRLTLSFAPRTHTLKSSGRISDVFLCRHEKIFHPNKGYVSVFSHLTLSCSPPPPAYWGSDCLFPSARWASRAQTEPLPWASRLLESGSRIGWLPRLGRGSYETCAGQMYICIFSFGDTFALFLLESGLPQHIRTPTCTHPFPLLFPYPLRSLGARGLAGML